MSILSNSYPASFKVDYPAKLDRMSTFFRALMIIPIFIILALLSGAGISGYGGGESWESVSVQEGEMDSVTAESKDALKEDLQAGTAGIATGLFVATALMIVFRQRYPRWWFDFVLELNRFTMRVASYFFLLTDKYPSTEDAQSVHVDLKYPDVKKDLNKWLPLVKWFLAIPHYIVLGILGIGVIFAVIIAWFAILFTGRYPKDLFEFVVGVLRWSWRVNAYAFLLTTDKYPAFSLK